MSLSSSDFADRAQHQEEGRPWFMRFSLWASAAFRPHLGWTAFLVVLLLSMMPAMALRTHNWRGLRLLRDDLTLVCLAAVLVTWLVLGWKRPRLLGPPDAPHPRRGWRIVLALVVLLISGALVISQLLLNWLPGPVEIVRTGNVTVLVQDMGVALESGATRFAAWAQGVGAGGATQDDLVLAAFLAVPFWWLGVATAWLARRSGVGLLAALPVLWATGLLLLYTRGGRFLMLGVLALALLLHLLLDHRAMAARWQRRGFDFNPGLLLDRVIAVLGAVLFVLTMAAVTPNVIMDSVVWRYYDWLAPVRAQAEDVRERLFPDLEGRGLGPGGGLGGGLPNDFLLSGGQELGRAVILRMRTDEPVPVDDYFEAPQPRGHYLRTATFSDYDGRGWDNPSGLDRTSFGANEPWLSREWPYRKRLVQTIFYEYPTSVLVAAGEPVEVSVEYRATVRTRQDLVALGGRARSYTAISWIPAVSNADLDALPAWGEGQPLPEEYQLHLAVPPTVTPRLRDLAQELTAGLDTSAAKARAIEQYLRQFEYDLTVSEPPADVGDVADFFIFDLQRGYCDYYATAFVVLARLAGLPTRFATGYAPGSWNSTDQEWVVTEAEAHSWPEVYFPQVGWVPYEPTAGRAELLRIGLPRAASGGGAPPPVPDAPEEPRRIEWNWQMLVWLLPVGALIWGVVWLLRRRAREVDPWVALVRWGARAGRPLQEGETVLEYGRELADFVAEQQHQPPDSVRYTARQLVDLSQLIAVVHYGPSAGRTAAAAQAQEEWQRLRGYLYSWRRSLP